MNNNFNLYDYLILELETQRYVDVSSAKNFGVKALTLNQTLNELAYKNFSVWKIQVESNGKIKNVRVLCHSSIVGSDIYADWARGCLNV